MKFDFAKEEKKRNQERVSWINNHPKMGIIKRQDNVIWLAHINLVRKNKIVSILKNESPVNFLLKKKNKLFILRNVKNHPSFFDSESFSKHCPSPFLNSKVSWNFDRLVVFFFVPNGYQITFE